MDKTKGLIFGTPAAITRYIASNGAGAAAKKYTRKSIQEAQKITKDKVMIVHNGMSVQCIEIDMDNDKVKRKL